MFGRGFLDADSSSLPVATEDVTVEEDASNIPDQFDAQDRPEERTGPTERELDRNDSREYNSEEPQSASATRGTGLESSTTAADDNAGTIGSRAGSILGGLPEVASASLARVRRELSNQIQQLPSRLPAVVVVPQGSPTKRVLLPAGSTTALVSQQDARASEACGATGRSPEDVHAGRTGSENVGNNEVASSVRSSPTIQLSSSGPSSPGLLNSSGSQATLVMTADELFVVKTLFYVAISLIALGAAHKFWYLRRYRRLRQRRLEFSTSKVPVAQEMYLPAMSIWEGSFVAGEKRPTRKASADLNRLTRSNFYGTIDGATSSGRGGGAYNSFGRSEPILTSSANNSRRRSHSTRDPNAAGGGFYSGSGNKFPSLRGVGSRSHSSYNIIPPNCTSDYPQGTTVDKRHPRHTSSKKRNRVSSAASTSSEDPQFRIPKQRSQASISRQASSQQFFGCTAFSQVASPSGSLPPGIQSENDAFSSARRGKHHRHNASRTPTAGHRSCSDRRADVIRRASVGDRMSSQKSNVLRRRPVSRLTGFGTRGFGTGERGGAFDVGSSVLPQKKRLCLKHVSQAAFSWVLEDTHVCSNAGDHGLLLDDVDEEEYLVRNERRVDHEENHHDEYEADENDDPLSTSASIAMAISERGDDPASGASSHFLEEQQCGDHQHRNLEQGFSRKSSREMPSSRNPSETAYDDNYDPNNNNNSLSKTSSRRSTSTSASRNREQQHRGHDDQTKSSSGRQEQEQERGSSWWSKKGSSSSSRKTRGRSRGCRVARKLFLPRHEFTGSGVDDSRGKVTVLGAFCPRTQRIAWEERYVDADVCVEYEGAFRRYRDPSTLSAASRSRTRVHSSNGAPVKGSGLIWSMTGMFAGSDGLSGHWELRLVPQHSDPMLVI
ncbi:unnamed protein product [Amoebophrya sp. A25]|nr:unnamed protein product [Amoebophrya sp. A25]|eukprot:GSA25T00020038001.1